ncbi:MULTISPECIES: type I-F CRISPR-associated endoribonuclease Cas6/Csy4 [Acinetobacter]|uniref:type I-F CRISPR-associated endoribonuclease Cas6/Csy4 n=1 Tax=Acinetobacter TaxID=469 RepID=UPI0002AE81F3|nr:MULTISPECIES: type I-F CRISPR-associated endoribonuclease Cas6/Csy4 [Acinetobacter]ELW86725.1 CRISPR-associated protein Cas6/Csy4, subtype I-F/YPEST [Acinetobacter sp. WC-743]MBI0395965.1 type I-F CRISPR-associated endoribonuclease Cas6/Csy4 [Acinetobacter bereziniae]MBJ8427283.1 type I-F CRISPR-associated endoribonuclease Cas6/Csy4 [Acinetobacter bereziniae]MBJ8476302.1 type I-F CRISPR-associated endoribonuclease Cas6/Csy4 [Acinetobacter bereziniae]
MKYYIEITLIESIDFSWFEVWSKLYTQLHIAFAEQIDTRGKIIFGISFPQYRIHQQKNIGFLGSKVRVFAPSESELQKLNLSKWLERLVDYVHITQPREVPKTKITGYAHYFRINPKMTLEERIAHQAQRRSISFDEAQQHFKQYSEQPEIVPYVSLKSLSTKREQNIDRYYRLYIGKSVAEEANDGKFGTYGLSRTATVPEF